MRVLRLLWLLLTYEMPKTRHNFWRYQMSLVGISLCAVWGLWDQPFRIWQVFLGGYCVARLWVWVLQHTSLANSDLLE